MPRPRAGPGAEAATGRLERLELRVERLDLTFRFTFAFHAREVRFERDAGGGYERVFPETFSFHPDRHDPAEVFLQLDDLARKPRLLAPRAVRRDAEILVSRLLLGIPRYLERMLDRLEGDPRLGEDLLVRVHQDVALLAQVVLRFVATRDAEERPGLRIAAFHLRKLVLRSLYALLDRRVEPEYLEAYVAGRVDPVNAADDLSESGFFRTMESGAPDAVNRSLLRLCERAFYRWLEEVCLDEENQAFELADSPFEGREEEVRSAISRDPANRVRRERDLVPFLRRPGNRDCQRVLAKLEGWFLRQYDIHHAAAVIQHADELCRETRDPDRVLSRHRSRNYGIALAVLVSPFVGAMFLYERAPVFFDAACSLELLAAMAGVVWYLGWRFCWKKNLTFFRASVPRIAAGIIVGYLPIFFIDEVWSLAGQSWARLATICGLLAFATLLYLYIEVQRRLRNPPLAFARARQIFLLGALQAFGTGLVITGLLGGFMASRNWGPSESLVSIEALRATLPPFVGELPKIVGFEPFHAFPSAVFLMTFLSFFIGTFLQLMWEDIPITEPL
jgi:hypothetical protein